MKKRRGFSVLAILLVSVCLAVFSAVMLEGKKLILLQEVVAGTILSAGIGLLINFLIYEKFRISTSTPSETAPQILTEYRSPLHYRADKVRYKHGRFEGRRRLFGFLLLLTTCIVFLLLAIGFGQFQGWFSLVGE